jgi:hypothetical protein
MFNGWRSGRWLAGLVLLAAASLGTACEADAGDRADTTIGTQTSRDGWRQQNLPERQRDLTTGGRYGGGYAGGTATGDTDAGAAFARWVLDQDPQRQYITDAVVRDDRTLGVKVQPTIRRGELQQLLTSLAQGMARYYPDRELDVVAFYQSGDKLAEAHYDPRTRRVDVRYQ